ncbi:Detected protein of unknown function [Hibiscus syriacus]|uniref:Uncharacterized protein n=1 Tax=Hibiscus syriacus TaxID=106335 RepID=A0A6A2Z9A6_HIBSY|nr:Detected protein of unknown function [Hibiscus syriacus]
MKSNVDGGGNVGADYPGMDAGSCDEGDGQGGAREPSCSRIDNRSISKRDSCALLSSYRLLHQLNSILSSYANLEEVEKDAKIIGNKGKLTSVAVEVRRKYDGELIAVAKQWTAFNQFKASWTIPRTKL